MATRKKLDLNRLALKKKSEVNKRYRELINKKLEQIDKEGAVITGFCIDFEQEGSVINGLCINRVTEDEKLGRKLISNNSDG